MLLSASELFFVGLIKGFLSVEPLDPPPEEVTRHWGPDEDPWSACKQIFEYANACGMEDVPEVERVNKHLPDVNVSAYKWLYRENHHAPGKRLSSEEVAAARESLRKAATEARRDLQERDPSGAVGSRFEELLAERNRILTGYSPQSPQFVYGLDAAGDFKVISQTRLIQQGTLRTVLRKLVHCLDATVDIYQCLGLTEKENLDWWEQWAEAGYQAWKPLNQLDRSRAIDVIDKEFIGQSKDDKPLLFGERLGHAGQLLCELGQWLGSDIQILEQFALVANSQDFIPANPEVYESDPDLANEPKFDELGGDSAGNGQEWCVEIRKLARRARVQVNLLGGVEDPGFETPCEPAFELLLKQLEECLEIAKDLGLDSVLPALTKWLEATEALLEEGSRPEGATAADWIRSQIDRRLTLLSFLQEQTPKKLVSLAFGELRLRDLSVDLIPAGVGAAALQGWAGLTKNARDSVRESLGMLQRGAAPYVVMSCAEPVLEVIARKLVEQHLDSPCDDELASMLYTLLQRAKESKDENLEAAASVGLALRLLRNRVSHNAAREYDKHEAAFFLNGLSLMLTALS